MSASQISCLGVLLSITLHLNSPAVETKGQDEVWPLSICMSIWCFSCGAPQSLFPVISYNILLFRGTPQQLDELFVALLAGKPEMDQG